MERRLGIGAVLAAVLCGCGSSSDGTGSVVRWKDDGVQHSAFSASVQLIGTSPIESFQIMARDTQRGLLSFGVYGTPPLAPGSYTCELPITGEAPAGNINYGVDGMSSWASSCTITVSSIGDATGGRVTGTFSAGLNFDDGTTVTPFSVTDGTYSVSLAAPTP